MSIDSANLSRLDEDILEDFEVFTFRDVVNVAAYMVMSAGRFYLQRSPDILEMCFFLEL